MNRSVIYMSTLRDDLQSYSGSGIYPFHMPGHKRICKPVPELPYETDVTEVEGTDDLHHANGILKDAMDRAAALWGADRSFFLVGGSTCGNLAGITAMVPYGSEVICQRNSHLSVFHAVELWDLKVHWLQPEEVTLPDGTLLCGSVDPKKVKDLLEKHPDVKGVILTSPTYEGVISDVKTIAQICHNRINPIPVLVDEAHGAHLGLFGEKTKNAGAFAFSEGAVAAGADLIVQSLHKTLPSLTQTAILHLQGNIVEADAVEEKLSVFETSSPSYPLMESIDGCVDWLTREGKKAFELWTENISAFRESAKDLEKLSVFSGNAHEQGVFAYDPGKMYITCGKSSVNGVELGRCLRERFHLETEMANADAVLAMTSPADPKEAYDRLSIALHIIDSELETKAESGSETNPAMRSFPATGDVSTAVDTADTAITIAEAMRGPKEEILLNDPTLEGRTIAEYLFCYPPGIPLLVPGEVIPAGFADRIKTLEEQGHTEVRRKRQDGILCRKTI